MMTRRPRIVELMLWAAGLACFTAVGAAKWHAISAEHAAAAISPSSATADQPYSLRTGTIGRLEIPDLGLVAPLVNDSEQSALTSGVAYVRGTALPGGLGNFAVAGHRDTFFRPLKGVRPGMSIRVVTPGGSYRYIVDGTRVVRPDDLSVLRTGTVPQMTLITCYPFHYIGPAPERFIVTAHLASL